MDELRVELIDDQWPYDFTDHTRQTARAVVFDDEYLYFTRADRDDEFGKSLLIETAGGGIEPGEEAETAVKRELKEELGAEVEIITKIGVVSDFYNVLHRHNISNYFLCRVKKLGSTELTENEVCNLHLSMLKLSWEEALREYEKCTN